MYRRGGTLAAPGVAPVGRRSKPCCLDHGWPGETASSHPHGLRIHLFSSAHTPVPYSATAIHDGVQAQDGPGGVGSRRAYPSPCVERDSRHHRHGPARPDGGSDESQAREDRAGFERSGLPAHAARHPPACVGREPSSPRWPVPDWPCETPPWWRPACPAACGEGRPALLWDGTGRRPGRQWPGPQVHDRRRSPAHGPESMPEPAEMARRLAVGTLFALHTVRFRIYLQPDQGRKRLNP